MAGKINVCIIGTGSFARPFIRCYQRHPDVGEVFICARNPERLKEKAALLGIDDDHCFRGFERAVSDPRVDAVHILTPTFDHPGQELAALEAGKHVAVAVSMGETLEQLQQIVQAKKKSGKNFMLMETAVYSREMFRAKELIESGELGEIQLISASHEQNSYLMNLEDRWKGYPPMLYGSHACAPLYWLTGKKADSVRCLGSGDLGEEMGSFYGCRDAAQSCLVSLKGSRVKGEVRRTLYGVMRQNREHFNVYGTKLAYEWELAKGDGALIHTSHRECHYEKAPDYTADLPDSLIYKGEKTPYHLDKVSDRDSLEYALRLGHCGSYPHLVNEFIRSICEERPSALDAHIAANITAIGICAVESAKRGGEKVEIPLFDD